jgi:hypothetical protein
MPLLLLCSNHSLPLLAPRLMLRCKCSQEDACFRWGTHHQCARSGRAPPSVWCCGNV